VPNWGQEPDKTFDVRLTDSSGDHEIYLTRLDFEPALPGRASPESARNSLRARAAAGERGAPGAAGLVSAALLVGGALVGVVLVSLAAAHVCRTAGKPPPPRGPAAAVVVAEKDAVIYDVSRARVVATTAGARTPTPGPIVCREL